MVAVAPPDAWKRVSDMSDLIFLRITVVSHLPQQYLLRLHGRSHQHVVLFPQPLSAHPTTCFFDSFDITVTSSSELKSSLFRRFVFLLFRLNWNDIQRSTKVNYRKQTRGNYDCDLLLFVLSSFLLIKGNHIL